MRFALVGGVVAVCLTGGRVSLGSLVGFVTVLGIAARNGILLVSHFRQLETEENMPFDRALVAKPGTLKESLLGMSFLSRLRSYEFAGEYLTLRS